MPEGIVFCCGVPFVSMDILWINTPLTPYSPALSGAIHFWKTEVRYIHGILLQLLLRRSVHLHERIPYCFARHHLFELQTYFCSIVCCPLLVV